MHGRGRISKATREKVLRGIQEAGYTPNINAQRLAVGRTHVVAVDFGVWLDVLSDMFFVELTRYVQDALEESGYGLLLNTRSSVLEQWAKSRAVDGVILVRGGAQETDLLNEIVSTGTPCVVIGQQPVERCPGVGSVVIGLSSGARQAARLLVEQGHRRIGFLNNSETENFVLMAFREELESLGLTLAEDDIIAAGRTPEAGFRGLTTLFSRSDPPTAVFARNDGLAVGALRAAHAQHIAVPTTLSLIGHDDVPFAALTEPPLTTVRVHCDELGTIATQMLLHLIEHPEDSPEAHIVPTELIVRETVAGPRRR